mmetsp:Transcript_28564/g.71787  ORF Transcript_28564/g.71787 Transcript_28564/m.71787 type:complete len:353 (+) Transcript_28564:245-1303(+)
MQSVTFPVLLPFAHRVNITSALCDSSSQFRIENQPERSSSKATKMAGTLALGGTSSIPERNKILHVVLNSSKLTRMLESLSKALRQARNAFPWFRLRSAALNRSIEAKSGSSQRYAGHCQLSRKSNSSSVMVPLPMVSSSPSNNKNKESEHLAKCGGKPCCLQASTNSWSVILPLRSASRARKVACKLPNFFWAHCLKRARSKAFSGANSVKEIVPVWSQSRHDHNLSKSPSYLSSLNPRMNSNLCKLMLPSLSSLCQRDTKCECFAWHHSTKCLNSPVSSKSAMVLHARLDLALFEISFRSCPATTATRLLDRCRLPGSGWMDDGPVKEDGVGPEPGTSVDPSRPPSTADP